jgi:mycothiol synthase
VLLNEITRAHWGTDEFTEEEVRSWFVHDELDVLVAEEDGRLVGYGDRWRERERDRAWLDIRSRPGDSATAAALLSELEQRAAPDIDPGAIAITFAASVNDTLAEVLEAAGYELFRHSFRMTIALGDAVAPDWPDGLRLTTYEPEHEAAIHAAHQEAFADHWEHKHEPIEEWRKWLVESPGFDPTFWFVLRDGDEVAGLSLCRIHSSGDAEHGFVSVLAVRRPWRRRGLGTALLRHSFADMQRRGMTKASLGVDAENTTGAVRLYELAGMEVERRFDAYRKEL